jgi:peptidoglycan hydrolase CwlO-like protein
MILAQADCDIRDYGKKVQQLEFAFDETNDKLTKATESLEEKEKQFKEVEGDVAALSRRIMVTKRNCVAKKMFSYYLLFVKYLFFQA